MAQNNTFQCNEKTTGREPTEKKNLRRNDAAEGPNRSFGQNFLL